MDDLPLFLTPDDVAMLVLRVDPRTVRRLVSAGKFPPADIHVGSKIVRWKRSTVESWIDAQGESAVAR